MAWIELKYTHPELLKRGIERCWVNLDQVQAVSFREATDRRPAAATLVFARRFSATTEDPDEVAAIREYLSARAVAGAVRRER